MGRSWSIGSWLTSAQQQLWAARGRLFTDCTSALVRRDSEFGLFKDIKKRAQILGRSLEGCWGPAPRPPGFIALGHQQVLPNVLAGFERTEAGVAARRQPLCRAEPGTVGL
jgi:hypothetical protein